MPTHATALFADRHAAHAAVEQLVQAGFTRDSISLVMTDETHEREFHAPPSEKSGVRLARPGGVLGAIVAGLVVLAWPEGASLRAGGPLVTAMLSAGEGAAALSPALVAAGIAEPEARFLDDGVRSGAIIVAVHAPNDRVRLALQLLELSGGTAQAA